MFADGRRGTKDLWKGEMDELSGWVSAVLLVFRPLGGRFVFAEDASQPIKIKDFRVALSLQRLHCFGAGCHGWERARRLRLPRRMCVCPL